MRWFYKFHLRPRSIFRKSRVEQELTDELHFHLQKLIDRTSQKGWLRRTRATRHCTSWAAWSKSSRTAAAAAAQGKCRSIVPHPLTLPGSGMAVCNTSFRPLPFGGVVAEIVLLPQIENGFVARSGIPYGLRILRMLTRWG